jgi:uncharacterized membrane protein YbhN (UPF0104 family)
LNDLQFIIQVCKGLVRHHRARRTLMFYTVLFAIILAFAGSTVLWPLLRNHPFIFLGYWAVCVTITFLAVLLALYDMVKIREEGRRERQRLREEYLESIKIASPAPPDSSHSSEMPEKREGTGTSD